MSLGQRNYEGFSDGIIDRLEQEIVVLKQRLEQEHCARELKQLHCNQRRQL